MKKVKYLIVGGGISGLCAANNLKTDDYLIIEKEERVGGLCQTFYQNSFVWDYAGHFFHFRTEKWKNYFSSRIQRNEFITCKKNTKIYYNNNLIDYPFQKNIHQLEKQEFIECLTDVYFKQDSDSYVNFQDMLYAKFGRGITEKFLKPYNEKLYACNLNSLDMDAIGRFFPYAQFDDIMKNIKSPNSTSYNDTFEYPIKGAQVFVDTLKKDIDEAKILCKASMSYLDLHKKVATVNEEQIQFEYLINTMAFSKFLQCMSKDEQKIIKDGEVRLSGNQVLVFNLGFAKKTNVSDVHWIYFPQKKINFYRVGFYDNILCNDRGSLYVEIGYEEGRQINTDEQLKITLENLKLCGIISDDNCLTDCMSLIINPGYVHVSQIEKVHKIKKKLGEFDVYTIGRYGGWTYCSIEDCLIEAAELAEYINEQEIKHDSI